MKKIMVLLLACLLLFPSISHCEAKAETPPRIVCTTFPQYDWTRQILGPQSDAELMLLLDQGIDLHSYQPTAMDIATISRSDLLIYVGGDSDAWVTNVLAATGNAERKALALLDHVEPLQVEDTAHHEEHGGHAHSGQMDEHVWLSLKNARVLVETIAASLAELDPVNAERYLANAQAYGEKLTALDDRYQAVADGAKRKTLLFADRFPFRYLARDYDLTYFAAFTGCSAETEASFETIASLVRKMDELALPVVLVLEGSDRSIAETVIAQTQNGQQKILTMHSIQSVKAKEIEQGTSYLLLMEENLKTLDEALNTI